MQLVLGNWTLHITFVFFVNSVNGVSSTKSTVFNEAFASFSSSDKCYTVPLSLNTIWTQIEFGKEIFLQTVETSQQKMSFHSVALSAARSQEKTSLIFHVSVM